MKKLCAFLGVTIFFLNSCSNIVKSTKVGDCLQHNYESGTYKVKKKSDTELVLEDITLPGQGPIKVVNSFYGGWYKIDCIEALDQ